MSIASTQLNNHQNAVVVQDLATQWIQSYPCIAKKLRKRKRVCESFSSRQIVERSFTVTILWNLQNPVKASHEMTEIPHHTSQRRTVLLNELYDELMKEHQQYCCNQVWMKNGGLVPWNVAAFCEMSTTSWETKKTPYDRRFGEPFRGPIIPFGEWSNIIRHPQEMKQDFISLVRMFYWVFSWAAH